MNAPAVALLTDFGLEDPYAGQMRAVLGRILPGTPILDLCHGVPPFSVTSGALFLASSRKYFADGTLFLCVVDPGVGSERPIHCLIQPEGRRHSILAPGNGLLSLAALAMREEGPLLWRSFPSSAAASPLASGTFHGRDVFPFLAAGLLNSPLPQSLGEPLAEDPPIPGWALPVESANGFSLTVLHTDRFGNCILNLPSDREPGQGLFLSGFDNRPLPLAVCGHYAAIPHGQTALVKGSQGFWELAQREESAAFALGLGAGDACALYRDGPA